MTVFGSFLNFYSLCARALPSLVPFSVTAKLVFSGECSIRSSNLSSCFHDQARPGGICTLPPDKHSDSDNTETCTQEAGSFEAGVLLQMSWSASGEEQELLPVQMH